MQRNKQTQRLKTLRKLDKKSRWLYRIPYVWVPVEEPQFLGWESQLILTTTRKDEDVIHEVLDAYNARKPAFFKDPFIVSFIRKHKTYRGVLQAWKTEAVKRKGWSYFLNGVYFPSCIHLLTDYISEQKYNKLSEKAKNYFIEKISVSPWSGSEIKEYRLGWMSNFPFYEIKYKVEKAYSTHRGIPISEEISESHFIHEKLRQEHYWCSKNGFHSSRETWTRRQENKTRRKYWSRLCHKLKGLQDYDDMELLESNNAKLAKGWLD